MKRMPGIAAIIGLFVGATLFATAVRPLPAQGTGDENSDNESRIQKGFAIAPVHLNLEGKNRALVGMGSYIVNGVQGCNACHTCPSFKPGHSPFNGMPEQINTDAYLAGGVLFAPT